MLFPVSFVIYERKKVLLIAASCLNKASITPETLIMDGRYPWGKCNEVWPYIPVLTSPFRPRRAWSPIDCTFYPSRDMYTMKGQGK